MTSVSVDDPGIPTTGVRIGLLDGFRLCVNQRSAPVPLAAQRLVALLALWDREVARCEVSGTLWPEANQAQANGCLRTALWRLRRAERTLVIATPTHLGLCPAVRTDTDETIAYARRLLEPADRCDGHPLRPQPLLGVLLPGWYDDWVVFERERLRQLTLHALESLADRLLDAGRFGAAADAAYGAIRADPLRESAHRTLIRVHLAEGNAHEALRTYRSYVDLLQRELGIGPSMQLISLIRPVLPREPRHSGAQQAAGRVTSS
ncbi:MULTISPECIES: AfsR/SARP family transcriptional regulator [unclassified Frankia]|uniref:AfsR/SARP family transcriptional regulator n=1 Tax=unclassified Frankia TaxID=2632575 RepID=UPI002AD45CC9|nr:MULTISPECIES: BTAD domain-containing putative transcriptional regulator [unclassified Frankia]